MPRPGSGLVTMSGAPFPSVPEDVVRAAVQAEPRHRALLVGIDDYSAGQKTPKGTPVSQRDFRNLEGAVRDVEVMQGVLTSVYKLKPGEIATLKNQAATRDAILRAIKTLIGGGKKGDVLLFYFSGHGSQVKNSLSEEKDHMDESIVPANTQSGALDIRDKELRRLFLPALDRGARLTIILDSCHSGSGVRGVPGDGLARTGPADKRDAKDGYRGPTLEDRGALVLSAARDIDLAYETKGFQEKPQGAFSWALTRAVRDAARNEPAIDTFRRVAARMRIEKPEQIPVIAGNAEARFTPLLGSTRKDRASDRVTAGVVSVDPNGLVTIDGGWANGLTLNSELRPVTKPPSAVRLQVISLDGMTSCKARIKKGSAKAIRSGSLLELVAWVAPQDRPLRVWVPQGDAHVVAAFARSLADAAKGAGLKWMEDPTASVPAYVVRWDGEAWESFDDKRRGTKLGPAPDAKAMLQNLSRGSSLFVQLPASPDIKKRITPQGGVERVKRPQDADYILAGRLFHGHEEYAWIRPSVDRRDQHDSPLPLRTDWHDGRKAGEAAADLNEDLRRLQRIHLWQTLPSPPEGRFNYRLGIRRVRDKALITDGTLITEEPYDLVLRAAPGPRELSTPRFVYAFAVDSYGESVLLFPRGPVGSIENRFPALYTHPSEIRLSTFIPQPPFGTDTYFLLSTDQALVDPWILEWDGVQKPKNRGETPLEQLLLLIMSNTRAPEPSPNPSRWSIERVPFATKSSAARIRAAR